MKFIHRILAKQARKPSGLLGKLAGHVMREKNRDITLWTLDLLELQPSDRVLEIGFGPGLGIEAAARRLKDGSISGVDLSDTMVATATDRNRTAIEAGTVDLRSGDAADLPYEDNTFDKAFAVNVLYFWPQPRAILREIRRVLGPGGRFALAFLSAADMREQPLAQTETFTIYSADDAVDMLTEVGFSAARYERAEMHEDGLAVCALAES